MKPAAGWLLYLGNMSPEFGEGGGCRGPQPRRNDAWGPCRSCVAASSSLVEKEKKTEHGAANNCANANPSTFLFPYCATTPLNTAANTP